MYRTLAFLALVGLMTTTGCSTNPPPDEVARTTPADNPDTTTAPDRVDGVATITFFDLEGGFYGLVADDGARYDPMNLDEAFQQDGLRVRFRAQLRTDVMTIRQWGKPVEILEIVRLNDQ